MIRANELPEVQGDVGDFVAEEPAKAEEGRGVSDDLLRLRDRSVPVGLLTRRDGGRPPLVQVDARRYQDLFTFRAQRGNVLVAQQERPDRVAFPQHRAIPRK